MLVSFFFFLFIIPFVKRPRLPPSRMPLYSAVLQGRHKVCPLGGTPLARFLALALNEESNLRAGGQVWWLQCYMDTCLFVRSLVCWRDEVSVCSVLFLVEMLSLGLVCCGCGSRRLSWIEDGSVSIYFSRGFLLWLSLVENLIVSLFYTASYPGKTVRCLIFV